MLCEMQSVSSRIWTCVAVSISYDDNHYTTGTSKLNVDISIHIYVYIHHHCHKKSHLVELRDQMTADSAKLAQFYHHHHHNQVILIAWIPLTLSHHPFLSAIALGRVKPINNQYTSYTFFLFFPVFFLTPNRLHHFLVLYTHHILITSFFSIFSILPDLFPLFTSSYISNISN